MTLLHVEDLHVWFSIRGKELHAVRGISFELFEGEVIGIVGESGCGKSAAMQAITQLGGAARLAGRALFRGRDLLQLDEKELRRIRGKEIGNIFQDPMTSLNPTIRIGKQIMEVLLWHKMATAKEAKRRALQFLELVGLPDPALCFSQYPHQLSGGMRQRVLIAIALICHPSLLIADEATTALDVTVQTQVLALLKKLQRRFSMSQIIISHDLSVVAKNCDRLLVIYAGKIVEIGPTQALLSHPQHPYTQGLLRSLPHKGYPLKAIEGMPPSLFHPPRGCAFAPRCPFATAQCAVEPPLRESVACWRSHDSVS